MSEVKVNTIVEGRPFAGNAAEQAARIKASEKSGIMTSWSKTVADSTTNLDVNADDSDFFGRLTSLTGKGRLNFFELYTSQAITLRVRTVQNAGVALGSLPVITFRANSLRSVGWLGDITNLYVTNASGSAADVIIEGI